MGDVQSITERLKAEARRLGFGLVGVCPAVSPAGFTRLAEWLERGFAGQMRYLTERAAAYEHPRHVLDGVRSLLMVGIAYRTADPVVPAAGQGRVSRYAWGTADYHDVMHGRLAELGSLLRTWVPDARVRGVVDTAPLLEREFAQLAGLGWIGKHTLLLNRPLGSWFFLAALLTDVELAYDAPFATDHCGSCRACLDACPTDAFPEPYVLDATRCISYLTIELRESIPRELRSGMGSWLFGCDVCQDVCPWNGRSALSRESGFAPAAAMNPVDLAALFELDEAAFRQRFRGSPLWRAKRRGILRNAAMVLGNRPHAASVPALVRGLHDDESMVRAACAWALGGYDLPSAREALVARRTLETDPEVLDELHRALTAPPR